jgi:hypothetical protein
MLFSSQKLQPQLFNHLHFLGFFCTTQFHMSRRGIKAQPPVGERIDARFTASRAAKIWLGNKFTLILETNNIFNHYFV